MIRQLTTLFFILLFFYSPGNFAKPVNILVSIKPLHSLVSQLTNGITKPALLLQQQQSPHHFQLRPSHRRLLKQADLFIYSDDSFEAFVPALKDSLNKLKFLPLSETKNIDLLKTRQIHSHHPSSTMDGHIWLSINNAKKISINLKNILSQADPDNQLRYQKNLQLLIHKLNLLQQKNKKKLNSILDKSYLVYHDAYQYFENENQLSRAFFVTTNTEHIPGIKRIKEIKKLISDENILCIYYEPPTIPSLLTTLTQNTQIQLFPLDPIGGDIVAGKNHYFELLQQTAMRLKDCLSPQRKLDAKT